jgi:metal-responsive CopG/Arc/MetJ family transcriptional regulator
MVMSNFSISMEDKLLQRIDKDRGMVPRSRFIAKLVADAYANKVVDVRNSDDGDLGRAPAITNTTHLRSDVQR